MSSPCRSQNIRSNISMTEIKQELKMTLATKKATSTCYTSSVFQILLKLISFSIIIVISTTTIQISNYHVEASTQTQSQQSFKQQASGAAASASGSLMSPTGRHHDHTMSPPSLTASLISSKSSANINHNHNQNHYNNNNHHTHHQHNTHQHHNNINPSNNIINNQQPQHASLISAPPTPQASNNLPTCHLPQTWAGRWYQANKETIRVTNTEFSDKGICRDQKGDKFLFENYNSKSSTNSQPCLVCLAINERHLNVLQYKESNCQQLPANYYNRTTSSNNQIIPSSSSLDDDHSLLDSICSDINADTQLESLFRLDTPSIECPITGQYALSYDNCRDPLSSLDSCIDKKQLNFKFSACPDVPGSESKYEVLKCYADWSEGNNYYMIGRLEHASNPSDRGKFRCFVYEKSSDGKQIQMSQSLEENFYELNNPSDGPKILRLNARPPTINNKCNFPAYIMNQSENWLSVDNSLVYMFNQNSTRYQVKETKEGNVIEEATCLQQFTHPASTTTTTSATGSNLHPAQLSQFQLKQQASRSPIIQPSRQAINRRHSSSASLNQPQQVTSTAPASYPNNQKQQQVRGSDTTVYLVQITKNCQTTNYCVRFHKRTSGIVQIDYFIHLPSDSTCQTAFVSAPQTQIITSTNLEHQRCPFEGAYTIEAAPEMDLTYNPSNIFLCPRQSFLTSQCDLPSRLRIHSKCAPNRLTTKNLNCLGSWTTNGLVRLLLVDDDRQRYSAWYRDYSGLASNSNLDDYPATTELALQQSLTNTPLTPIIDLQIALLTPLPIVTKAMPVRLTRRHHCSELVTSASATMSQQQQTNTQLLNAYSSPSYYPPISSPSFSMGNNIAMGNNGAGGSSKASPSLNEQHSCIILMLIISTSLMTVLNVHSRARIFRLFHLFVNCSL